MVGLYWETGRNNVKQLIAVGCDTWSVGLYWETGENNVKQLIAVGCDT